MVYIASVISHSRPAAAVLALLLAAFALPASAQTQDSTWQAELQIDQELDAFEDPTLLRVLTLEPNSEKRLFGSQPFKQQPLFSQQDFRPPIDPVATPCVVVAGKACR